MNPILSVASLTTVLADGTRIVDNLSFDIGAGETFALLGESGCGKSMTALSLMRLLPDGSRVVEGAVSMQNRNIAALPEREMCDVRGQKIAMIFQEPGLSLNPVLTIGEQISEVFTTHPFSNAGHPQNKKEVASRCLELLRQVGIPDPERRLTEYPFQLSGGMKQRVMIAIALAGRPQLLIADEPTTALDVTTQAQVLQLLRDIQQQNGMAILLITHDLGVVAENAHQVAVMYAGQLVEKASRAQLFSQPAHPYTRKLFAALPEKKQAGQRLTSIPGNVPALNALPSGCRFAPRCDLAWSRCHQEEPAWHTLDDGQSVRCHLFGTAAEEEFSAPESPQNRNDTRSNPSDISAPPLLEVIDLHVHFPIRQGVFRRTVGHVQAVNGISLAIAPGRTVALVGESGCGKTTAGKALMQLIPPTAGRICFEGQALVGRSQAELRKHRAGMQMIFQDPFASLNPKMRVAEILREGMEALDISPENSDELTRDEARRQHIEQLLAQVGLPIDAQWRYPHEFSGGQRQRIAIARALAVAPKLLICDEPTSALDVSVQAQILNLMQSLQQRLKLSYLLITHNLAVVEYLADEVCVMYLGRIVERGSVGEIIHSARHPYTQALLSAVPRINPEGKPVIRLVGEMPSPAHPPSGCHFHPRCPRAAEVCRTRYPAAVSLSATHTAHCHFL